MNNIEIKTNKIKETSRQKKIGNHSSAMFLISVFVGYASIFYNRPMGLDVFLPGPKLVQRGWPAAFLSCTPASTVVCHTDYFMLMVNIAAWFLLLGTLWMSLLSFGWLCRLIGRQVIGGRSAPRDLGTAMEVL